jgi:thiol:disulfide interchange protein DsbD
MIGAMGLIALASRAQELNPVHWKSAGKRIHVQAGSVASIPISAELDAGWHLYSLKKMEDGPIATTIALAAGQAFTLDGKIRAPQPIIADEPSLGMTVEYYLGSVEFVLPVRATAGATPGDRTLTVLARYQSCSDQVCLPPKQVRVEIPVTVDPAGRK